MPEQSGPRDVSSEETNTEGTEAFSAPSGSTGDNARTSNEQRDPSSDADFDFESLEAELGGDPLVVKIQADLDQLKDELARSRAETYNVRQEYGNFVRRSKEEAGKRRVEGQHDVVEAVMPVLDDIAAARAAGELAGPFASIADKLEGVLSASFGYESFGQVGDHFDPALHDALMMQPNPDASVKEQVIGQVLSPGYRTGDRVLRPAKVLVFDPQ